MPLDLYILTQKEYSQELMAQLKSTPIYVTVPEKRDLNEANFILRYKPFKNVCHTETNVNFKLYRTITLDWTGLCSYFKVHSVELIKKEKKMDIPQFS